MENVTVKRIFHDVQKNQFVEQFLLNGIDDGTDHRFENDTVSLIWTANQYVIVDLDGHPITEGDYEWIAIKNSLVNAGFLIN